MRIHRSPSPDPAPRNTVARGAGLERRGFLATAAASLLLTRRGPAAAQEAGPPEEDLRLDYERFLALAVPVARELVRDTSRLGEDRYLHTLAALAARLTDVPVPEMQQKGEGAGPHTYIGANDGGDPFTVLHWRMDPGSVIGLHAHTFGNVVTLGLQGAARIQNFEVLGEPDFEAQGTFRVRRSIEQVLVPGEINLVPLSHRYCHGFLAGPEGARGLDITTRIRPKRVAPVLEVAGEPLDELGCVFEARWRSG